MTLELRVIQALVTGQYRASHDLFSHSPSVQDSPHVNGRVKRRLGRFRLLGGGIDGGERRLRARDLAGGSHLFTVVAHFGDGDLIGQKTLKVEVARP